jgi:hypothetical protein
MWSQIVTTFYAHRFIPEFVFILDREEAAALRYHFGTLKPGRGQHRKYLPPGT